MIFDRKGSHVAAAKRLRREKVQQFIPLTDEEIEVMERGFVTLNTINRIEGKQRELKEILNSMGYWNNDISTYEWDSSKYFIEDDFKRFIRNISVLRQSFFVFKTTPTVRTFSSNYNYIVFNNIEKVLFDIEEMSKQILNNYRLCGTFICGG